LEFNAAASPPSSSGALRTIYVDSNAGQDSNDGLSAGTAWKTLGKINRSSFAPGDTTLLVRGGVWNETLTVPASGSSGNPITLDAYGSGGNPIIDGGAQSRQGIVLIGKSYTTPASMAQE
jgi:hypothetical protein